MDNFLLKRTEIFKKRTQLMKLNREKRAWGGEKPLRRGEGESN